MKAHEDVAAIQLRSHRPRPRPASLRFDPRATPPQNKSQITPPNPRNVGFNFVIYYFDCGVCIGWNWRGLTPKQHYEEKFILH